MKSPDARYRPQAHVFVCNNRRPPGAELPCCALANGEVVLEQLRAGIARSPLRGRVWVTASSCLTFCSKAGATVAIYPTGTFFHEVRVEDIPTLIKTLIEALAQPRPAAVEV